MAPGIHQSFQHAKTASVEWNFQIRFWKVLSKLIGCWTIFAEQSSFWSSDWGCGGLKGWRTVRLVEEFLLNN